MTEVRWRVYARGAAALALMLMLGDPALRPGGTTRAQASSQAPPAAQAATAAAGQARPSLLVLNKAENTLAVVDPATMQVVARIPTGEGPHEVVVSSDGRTAYVSNYGGRQPGNSLSVIDLAARKELKRFQVGEAAVGIAVSRDSRRAYVASMATGKVTAVDLETLAPAGSVQTGRAPDGLAWVRE